MKRFSFYKFFFLNIIFTPISTGTLQVVKVVFYFISFFMVKTYFLITKFLFFFKIFNRKLLTTNY